MTTASFLKPTDPVICSNGHQCLRMHRSCPQCGDDVRLKQSQWITVDDRVRELIHHYEGVRKAARALDIDPGYLIRLRDGGKTSPGDDVLEKLGLQSPTILYRRTS